MLEKTILVNIISTLNTLPIFFLKYPQTLSFLPPQKILDAFEKDYNQMREQMIYGENINAFQLLISRLKELLHEFRKLK